MVSKIETIREINGCDCLVIVTHNGQETRFKGRTGSPLQKDKSEWKRGFSGIPAGEHWLWNFKNRTLQVGEINPKNGEIGEFRPISSSKELFRVIASKTMSNKRREEIGLHPENGFKGSAGCVVIVESFKRLSEMLYDTPEWHIPFVVRWKE